MQDYELANQEAETLFKSLNITFGMSEPQGSVSGDWPCIFYHFTFSRLNRFFSGEYRLGIGYVKYDVRYPSFDTPSEFDAVINTLRRNPSARLVDKMLHARFAAFLAKRQKIYPKAYEVLAAYCRDAMEARDLSFEDWAENLGYDSDSRKAEATYNKIKSFIPELVALIGVYNMKKFAELASRF